ARIVALVAMLAAFAALGRIAFAALPNVKPTTDIVLISGYALGGPPGFVVGALAGLTSNFFFGQGPWTPWQMAAWGATGMLGAGLALLARGSIRRWPLALVCGLVGYAFAAFQDLGDWVNYSGHSLAQLGVYVGKGTGFDFVHAAGCLAFALAFGPSLTRSVARFARRLQVTWLAPGRAMVPCVLGAVVLAGGWVVGAAAPARAQGTPSSYLLSAQNADGGFGPAPASTSSELFSGWAALGLAADGHDPQAVRHGGRSVVDYIRAGLGSGSDPGSVERTILVLRAAGLPVTSFGGQNLLTALQGEMRGDGSVSGQVNLTAFAMLALRAAGVGPAPRTISWLVRQQDSDGGFNFATAGGSSDVDDTGAVLEALAGANGVPVSTVAKAVGFIRAQQNHDGGLPSQAGADSNAQSTAFAVQGLLAAGVDPGSLHRGGASPVRYLRSLIAADGHVQYSSSSDQTPVWVTGQALMALAGKALPLAPPAGVPSPAVHPGAAPAKAPARGSNRPRARVRRVARRRPRAAMLSFAADVGFVTALVLAPMGAG
ncbi:MAG: prenyltransferase/squalene oxidase repeat-containing protein, partial [Solirubrobacteraceae bacterium]